MTVETNLLLILGAGRLAEEVAEIIADIADGTVAGFVEGIDRNRSVDNQYDIPIHWIDDIESLAATHRAVAAIGDPARRGDIVKMEEMGFQFTTLIHPSTHLAGNVRCGVGSVIGPGAVVGAAVSVGRHVYINRGALIGHHTRVGDYCTIGPGVNIAGGCAIGSGSFIGIGATFVDRIILGPDSLVAAGSVVTRSFPDGARIGGHPARPMPVPSR